MKLECSAEKIKESISQVEKIISKNSTLEALNSVLITALKKSLMLRSTNLSLGIEIEIPGNIIEEGDILIPGNILNNTILNLSGEKIIKMEQKENNLVLSNKNNSIILKSVPKDDFPTIPRVIDGNIFKIMSSDLVDGMKEVFYSASISDIKPEISSVCLYTNQNKIYFVATDSFRLAEKSIKNDDNLEVEGILIPYKNVVEIIRIFSNLKEKVEVIYNKNQISFTSPGFYLTSRLIDGIFPDYNQIIPKEYKTSAIVLKNDIQNALKLSSVFADKFNQITLNINPKDKKFEIYAENKDIGENKTNLEGSLKGEEVKVNINLKYLLDCFQSIKEDSISINLNGSNKPIIIKGNSDKSFQYLIMPMNR